MKRIFLYLLMAISVAVFAQQQASDEPDSSDETQAPTEQPRFAIRTAAELSGRRRRSPHGHRIQAIPLR